MLTVHAPAKVNLVLEVLARHDGYHDICSIVQTIDLCDTLTFEPSRDVSFTCSEPSLMQDNLMPRAAHLLQERRHVDGGALIHLEKRIPWAAGLGGGSSDAAATLLALNRLWKLGMNVEQLSILGAELGSDVPLFLVGGTVRIEGRGEAVRSLPDHPQMHAVILTPLEPAAPGKTGLLYRSLEPRMFTTGQFVRAAEFSLQQGKPVPQDLMYNVFEKVADDVFPSMASEHRLLADATRARVHLAGSGPSLYSLLDSPAAAHEAARQLRRAGRQVFVAHTLKPADSVTSTL
jgi:4-diphosphocytidyl-2-C-methyl-D-erythritol kinase